MINILKQYGVDKKGHPLARQLFLLLSGCVNPETNRVELNGRAMNVIDICAYGNYTNKEVKNAVAELMTENIILRVMGCKKDFFYINPEYMRDPKTPPCLLDWLVELFEQSENNENKELVYFEKGKRRIAVDIGSEIGKYN